jgi:hypothetical protein
VNKIRGEVAVSAVKELENTMEGIKLSIESERELKTYRKRS